MSTPNSNTPPETPSTASSGEAEALAALASASPGKRALGYFKLMGPGYMQSAMTLGGGTAFASIFAGAAFGYELLWVAPLSMLLGVIVLSAVAHQTLSTGEEPFQAMRKHAGGFFAYGWGIAAILSSIIWQFAQYALASAMLLLLAEQVGLQGLLDTLGQSVGRGDGALSPENIPNLVMGLVALAWCVTIGLMYDRSSRLVRVYENVLKGMVWLIIVCFGIVVVRTGIPEPGRVMSGLIPHIPNDAVIEGAEPIKPLTVIVAGLAAAVGVNMLFVYPYTLRRRGWGREHRRLARFDLAFGMFIPYAIAASLILIASASVLHFQSPEEFPGRKIAPDAVAKILASPDRLGAVVGVWVFGLGIVAMALSSITMQMLSSGFACETMFGWKRGTKLHMVGTLLPAIGVLGAVFWQDVRMWMAVPTTVICGLLMPVAYVGFIILQRSKRYLGADRPEGSKGMAWVAGMVVATIVLIVFLGMAVVQDGPGYIKSVRQALTGAPEGE